MSESIDIVQENVVKEYDKKKKNIWLHIIWILFAAIGLFVLLYFLWQIKSNYTISPYAESNVDIEKSAQVGDFVGGLVGALWSFAGIILFFLALKLQRDELDLTRDVLIDSVQAQKDTQAVMEKQLESLKYNSDLETLNYLISAHSRTIKKLNKKGLISQEENLQKESLQKEINNARTQLLGMANKIIANNKKV